MNGMHSMEMLHSMKNAFYGNASFHEEGMNRMHSMLHCIYSFFMEGSISIECIPFIPFKEMLVCILFIECILIISNDASFHSFRMSPAFYAAFNE